MQKGKVVRTKLKRGKREKPTRGKGNLRAKRLKKRYSLRAGIFGGKGEGGLSAA